MKKLQPLAFQNKCLGPVHVYLKADKFDYLWGPMTDLKNFFYFGIG